MVSVQRDKIGLYVAASGYVARPGITLGDIIRMDESGIQPGTPVQVSRSAVFPTDLAVVTLPDGSRTHWHLSVREAEGAE